MPPGVNWYDLPLMRTWASKPRPSLLPDIFRYLQLGWMAVHYAKMAHPNPARTVKVLDAGAGLAELRRFIRANRLSRGMDLRYVAVHVDPRKRRIAQSGKAEIDYRLCDMRIDLFDTVADVRPFDVIVFSEVVEHFVKLEGEQMLHDLCKLLKPKARRSSHSDRVQAPPEPSP